MRRWLSVFLLVLLPLQFVWAGVGVYVAHETGTASFHYGDHEHPVDPHHADTYATASLSPDAASPDSSSNGHPAHEPGCTCGDCEQCGHDAHAHFVAVPGADSTPSSFAAANGITMSTQARLNAIAPARPERPKWRAPA